MQKNEKRKPEFNLEQYLQELKSLVVLVEEIRAEMQYSSSGDASQQSILSLKVMDKLAKVVSVMTPEQQLPVFMTELLAQQLLWQTQLKPEMVVAIFRKLAAYLYYNWGDVRVLHFNQDYIPCLMERFPTEAEALIEEYQKLALTEGRVSDAHYKILQIWRQFLNDCRK